MLKRRIRLLCVALAFCQLFVCTASFSLSVVHADTIKEYEDEKRKAEASRQTAEMLVAELQEVNQKIAETAAEIEEKNAQIEKLDQQISDAENGVTDIDDLLWQEKRRLSEVIALSYETQASDSVLKNYVKANSIAGFINTDEYASGLGKYLKNSIARMQTILEKKEKKTEELWELRNIAEQQMLELKNEKAKMEGEIEELTKMMKEAEKKAEDAEAFAAALEDEVKRLQEQEKKAMAKINGMYDYTPGVNYGGDGTSYYQVTAYPYTDDELKLMASIIEAEAGSTSYPGMVAVGSVIMNRMASPKFANTLQGVIYAPSQFEPVQIGTLAVIMARGPAQSCLQAAKDVLDGKRNVQNFYFKATWYAKEHGITGIEIGGNTFH